MVLVDLLYSLSYPWPVVPKAGQAILHRTKGGISHWGSIANSIFILSDEVLNIHWFSLSEQHL